jgi:predicted DNA-binding transcriptional regulator YafY
MAKAGSSRRRPHVRITLLRASRLYRLVVLLAKGSQSRETLGKTLGIGLRTFYRELELLRRCGVKIQLREGKYLLGQSADKAEALLPFPDPGLSFAEMRELASGPGEASRRLAALLAQVKQGTS